MSQSDEVISKIDVLRRGNKDFITNAFFSTKHLISMIDSNKVITHTLTNVIVILLVEEQLIRLYFYATNMDSLRYISEGIPYNANKPVLVDIVGKNPNVENLSTELEKYNFSKYNKLIRMNRKHQESTRAIGSNVEFATMDDVNQIMDILFEEFDIYTSQLPTRQKLIDAISKREITIVTQQDIIVGLAYFETLGERLKYLYQIVLRKNYRGIGIADDLLMYTFENCSRDTSFQLWVETQNKPAISKYQYYNFVPDGLIDYIMLYRGE